MPRTKKYYDEPSENLYNSYQEDTSESSPSSMETNGPETKNGIIYGALSVKMRKRPLYTQEVSDVIMLLQKGTRVEILGKDSEYYKVRVKDGREGYVSSYFLKEE